MALRVGIVQLEYRPYFILGTRNCFGEPLLRDKKETALWQAMEGQDVCLAVEQCCEARVKRIIAATIRAAKKLALDVLVFPEYAVPPSCLDDLATCSQDVQCMIVPGSHTIQLDASAVERAYRNNDQIRDAVTGLLPASPGSYVAVSPVLLPDKTVRIIKKHQASKYEDGLTGLTGTFETQEVSVKGKPVKYVAFICSDALNFSVADIVGPRKGTLLFVIARTPDDPGFAACAELAKKHGLITVYANHALSGGSRVVGAIDPRGQVHWDLDGDGTKPLPPRFEGLLVVSVDPNAGGSPSGEVAVSRAITPEGLYSFVFQRHCPLCERACEHLNASGKLNLAGWDFDPSKVSGLPQFLQERLQLVATRKKAGTAVSMQDEEYLLGAIPIPLTSWEEFDRALVHHAYRRLADKLKAPSKAHLPILKTMELLAQTGVEGDKAPPIPDDTIPVGFSPLEGRDLFLDRETEDSELEKFTKEASKSLCLLLGPPGIGRKSLLQRFLSHKYGHTSKIPVITLSRGPDYADFEELIFAGGSKPASALNNPQSLTSAIEKFVALAAKGGVRAIKVEGWDHIYDPDGQFVTEAASVFAHALADPKIAGGVKVFAVSRWPVQVWSQLGSGLKHIRIKGLDDSVARMLVRELAVALGESHHELTPERVDRLLSLGKGHPLALRLLTSAAVDFGWEELLRGKSLYVAVLPRLIESLMGDFRLTKAESLVACYSALFSESSTPFLLTQASLVSDEELARALSRLERLGLIERSENRVRMHPLISEYFKMQSIEVLGVQPLKQLHSLVTNNLRIELTRQVGSPEFRAKVWKLYVFHALQAGRADEVKQVLRENLLAIKDALFDMIRMRLYEEAEGLATLLNANVKSAWSLGELARIKAYRGKWAEAKDAAEAAINLDRNVVRVFGDLANIALLGGNAHRADEYVQLAQKHGGGGHFLVLLASGRIAEREKREDDAVSLLAAAFSAARGFSQTERSAFFYVRALTRRSECKKSLEVLEAVEAQFSPLSDRLIGLRAQCHVALNELDEAYADLVEQVERGNPELQWVKALLALDTLKKGLLTDAEASKMLSKIQPSLSNPHVVAEVGYLLSTRGAPGEGLRLCRMASRRAPQDMHVRVCLLMALSSAAEKARDENARELEHSLIQEGKLQAYLLLRLDSVHPVAVAFVEKFGA